MTYDDWKSADPTDTLDPCDAPVSPRFSELRAAHSDQHCSVCGDESGVWAECDACNERGTYDACDRYDAAQDARVDATVARWKAGRDV